jgi:hypothetical protein
VIKNRSACAIQIEAINTVFFRLMEMVSNGMIAHSAAGTMIRSHNVPDEMSLFKMSPATEKYQEKPYLFATHAQVTEVVLLLMCTHFPYLFSKSVKKVEVTSSFRWPSPRTARMQAHHNRSAKNQPNLTSMRRKFKTQRPVK